ncbi:MAG: hypothetical protein CMH77_01815 [Nitrospinae bacterium]|nr:hypothetical protein [Nitrospinota bacterium]
MSCSSVMKLPGCYRMLHVSPGVKWEETKKSYRGLALKFHSDHHPDIEGSESRFMEVSSAFKALEFHYQTSGIQK